MVKSIWEWAIRYKVLLLLTSNHKRLQKVIIRAILAAEKPQAE
jgi:hypothetical protein